MEYVKHLNLFGVEAKEIPCIMGAYTPTSTTVGAVGCLYMNTMDGKMYKCVGAADGVYTWVSADGKDGKDGEKGEKGEPFTIAKTYASIDEMNADFDNEAILTGALVMIVSDTEQEDNAKLYCKGDTGFVFIVDMSGMQGIQGPKGADGYTPVKGTDYFTETERQEMVAYAASVVAAHRYALSYESPLSFGASNESDLTAIANALPDNSTVVFWINDLSFPAVFAEIAEQSRKIRIPAPYGIVTMSKFANVTCVKWEHYMTLDTLVNRYSIVNGVGWTGWADATALAAAEGVEF